MKTCPEDAFTNGVLKGGDSFPCGSVFLFHRATPPPRTRDPVLPALRRRFYLSASPAARMFFAALTSRSWTVPQDGHVQVRTFSGIAPAT
jgi:hypothetical protein